MLRVPILILLAVLPAAACIWDRDTLKEEAANKLDTVEAITGWFDRYPDRYYQMRLERVTQDLKATPDALDLYDDAGVACDRQGRHDEAIAWMEKKKAVLDTKPPDAVKEERYRYLSNLGTFHLLRWASKPGDARAADLSDLKTSETLITQALELNPDAHFGREKFQLMFIRWLLGSPEAEKRDPNFLNLDQWRRSPPHYSGDQDFTLEEARKGITGLIELGAAWESVDVFQTLQICLHADGSTHLAHLAYLRQKELYDAGARSFHPLKEVGDLMAPQPGGGFHGVEQVAHYYAKARAAADQRRTAWLAYQEERFAKGMHPDTNPEFWMKWKEPKFPALPGPSFGEYFQRNPILSIFVIFLLLGAGLLFCVKAIKWMLKQATA